MIKIGCSLFLATAAAIEVNATIIDKFDTFTSDGYLQDVAISRNTFMKSHTVDTRDDVTNFAPETCSKISAHTEKMSVMEALFQENNLLKAAMERMIEHALPQKGFKKDKVNSTRYRGVVEYGKDDINSNLESNVRDGIYVNK